MNTKELLLEQCERYVNTRYETIEKTITSYQKDLNSETKSSAGDKHETGRAMLQLEMEKAGQQLASIQKMRDILAKIDSSKTSTVANLGAVIYTNNGNYFLSISAGQIEVGKTVFFAISSSSPIGNLLLGKKVGDIIFWNQKEIVIQTIS